MKVNDFMHKPLITVSENDPIKKVLKIIFNLSFSAIPVVSGKKLVGIVTEQDILSKLFPSVRDYMEDYWHSNDFEAMEKKLKEIMYKPVKEIMNRRVRTVRPDAEMMRAQSMILVNNFSHLPITNEKNELVGIISQGDIFRLLVGSEIPFDDTEEFRDWISQHYDMVETWELRLSPEVTSLMEIFKKNNVKRVADVICGTGEHAISLAKNGYGVAGFDRSNRMINVAKQKFDKLPVTIKNRIAFNTGGYLDLLSKEKGSFDGVILMGNGLPYETENWQNILAAYQKKMSPNGLMIIQIRNFVKVMGKDNGLVDFSRSTSKLSNKIEYIFTMYYGAPTDTKEKLTATMAIKKYDGFRWSHVGINSIHIAPIDRPMIEKELKKIGFKNIDFFGSLDNNRLFDNKFDSKKHDWLNVVATR